MQDLLPEYKTESGYLYFTITNAGYIQFVLNFCKRNKELNTLKKLIIVCTDKESYNQLTHLVDCVCVYFPCFISKTLESWLSTNYKEIVFKKLDITRWVLQWAQLNDVKRVVYLDTDMWVYKDFVPYLEDFVDKTYDIVDVIMQDGENYADEPFEPTYTITPSTSTLEIKKYCTRLCTGLMILKPNNIIIDMFDYKSNRLVDWSKYVGNQPFLNDTIDAYQITAMALPRRLAINGSVFNITDIAGSKDKLELKLNKLKCDDTWLLHYTYSIGIAKIEMMTLLDHWVLNSIETQAFLGKSTGKPDIYVRCPDGFANQLRILLAGVYLMQTNSVNSFTIEWVLNNHNNVNFLDYFEKPPGITIKDIDSNIDDEKIIKTCSFEYLINKYAKRGTLWNTALSVALKYLILKREVQLKVDSFVKQNKINESLGVHARRTCKTALLEGVHDRSLPLTNTEILSICRSYTKVYVATDNKETQDFFIKELNDSVVVYKPIIHGVEHFPYDEYSRDGVQRYTDGEHNIMDFLTLKQCKTFLGSNESSYSLLLFHWRKNGNDYHVFGKL